jgi:hypothetical protein
LTVAAARRRIAAMSDAQLVLVIFAMQDLRRAGKFYVDAFG